jgi:hypothetical protein
MNANQFEEDFIAFEVIKNSNAAEQLIDSIEWDNWKDDEEEEDVYFKVESVLWNKLMAMNEDEGIEEDEGEYIYSQVALYFQAVNENMQDVNSINSFILEKYFEELTIEYATFSSFMEVYNNENNLRSLINSEVNVSTLNLE